MLSHLNIGFTDCELKYRRKVQRIMCCASCHTARWLLLLYGFPRISDQISNNVCPITLCWPDEIKLKKSIKNKSKKMFILLPRNRYWKMIVVLHLPCSSRFLWTHWRDAIITQANPKEDFHCVGASFFPLFSLCQSTARSSHFLLQARFFRIYGWRQSDRVCGKNKKTTHRFN